MAGKTGETAFNNPAVFSGLPFYNAGSIRYLDSRLFQFLAKLNYIFIFFFLLGSFGFYFLLRYLKLKKTSCFFGATAFLLINAWSSYIEAGHLHKFMPIMYIPILTLLLLKILDKPNLLNISSYIVLQIFQIDPCIIKFYFILCYFLRL